MERSMVCRDSNIKMEVKEEPEYIYVDETPKGDKIQKVMADVKTDESRVLGHSQQPSRRGRRRKILHLQRADSSLGVSARKILPRPQMHVPNYKISSPPMPISQLHQTPVKTTQVTTAAQQPCASNISITSSPTSQVAICGGGTGRKILPRPQLPMPLVHSQQPTPLVHSQQPTPLVHSQQPTPLLHPQQQTVPIHQLQPITPGTPPTAQALPLNQLQSISPGSIVPIHPLPSNLPITPLKPVAPTQRQNAIPLSPNKSPISIGASRPAALSQLKQNLPVTSSIVPLIQSTPPVVAKLNGKRKQKQSGNLGPGRKLLPRPQRAIIRPPTGVVIHSHQQAALPIPHLQPLTPVSTQQAMSVHQIQSVPSSTSQNLSVHQLPNICQVSASHTIPLQQIQNINPVSGQQNIALQPLQSSHVSKHSLSPQQAVPISTHQAMPLCQPHTTSPLGAQQTIPVQQTQTMTSGSTSHITSVQHLQTLTPGNSNPNVPIQQLQTISSGSHQIFSVQQIGGMPPVNNIGQNTTLPQMQSISPISVHQALPVQQLPYATSITQHQVPPMQHVQAIHSTINKQGIPLQQVHSIMQDRQQILPLQQYCSSNSSPIAPRQVRPIPALRPINSTSVNTGIPNQTLPLQQLQSELSTSDKQVLPLHQISTAHEDQSEKIVVKPAPTLPRNPAINSSHNNVQPVTQSPQNTNEHPKQVKCNISKQDLQVQPVTSPSQIHSSVPDLQQQNNSNCLSLSLRQGQETVPRKKVSKLLVQPHKTLAPFSKLKLRKLRQKNLSLLCATRRKKPILKIGSVTSYPSKKSVNIHKKNLFTQAPMSTSTIKDVSRTPIARRKILPRPVTSLVCDASYVQAENTQPVTTMSYTQNTNGLQAQSEVITESVKTIFIPPVTSSEEVPSQMTMYIPELQLNTSSLIHKTVPYEQNNMSSNVKQERTETSETEESEPFLQLVSPAAAAATAACVVVSSYDLESKEIVTQPLVDVTPSVHCIADIEDSTDQETKVNINKDPEYKMDSRSSQPTNNTQQCNSESQESKFILKQEDLDFSEEYIEFSTALDDPFINNAANDVENTLQYSSDKCSSILDTPPSECQISENIWEMSETQRDEAQNKTRKTSPKQLGSPVNSSEYFISHPDNFTLQDQMNVSNKALIAINSGCEMPNYNFQEEPSVSNTTSIGSTSPTSLSYNTAQEVRVVDKVATYKITTREPFSNISSNKQEDITMNSDTLTSPTSLTTCDGTGSMTLEHMSSYVHSVSASCSSPQTEHQLTTVPINTTTSLHQNYLQSSDENRGSPATPDNPTPQESDSHPREDIMCSWTKQCDGVSCSTSACHSPHSFLSCAQRDCERTRGKELSEIRRLKFLIASQRKTVRNLWRRLRFEKSKNKKLQGTLKSRDMGNKNISKKSDSVKEERENENRNISKKSDSVKEERENENRNISKNSDSVRKENENEKRNISKNSDREEKGNENRNISQINDSVGNEKRNNSKTSDSVGNENINISKTSDSVGNENRNIFKTSDNVGEEKGNENRNISKTSDSVGEEKGNENRNISKTSDNVGEEKGNENRNISKTSECVREDNTKSVCHKGALTKTSSIPTASSSKKRKRKSRDGVEENIKKKHTSNIDDSGTNTSNCSHNIANNFEKWLFNSKKSDTTPACSEEEEMKRLIHKFMKRDDVSELCKKTTSCDETKPVRYRLHYLSVLHKRFIADCCKYCTFEMFIHCIPQNVQKCKAEDMNVSVCINCQNPELKIESMVKRRFLSINTRIEDIITDESVITSLITTLKSLKSRKALLTYSEWSVNTDGNSPQVPQKMTLTKSLSDVASLLENELLALVGHLQRIHQQYEATYEAKCEADSSPHHAVIQTEWSPLIILHSLGKNGLPEPQRVISLQCGYMWSQKDSTGFVAISSSIDRTAPAVCASLETVLKKLIKKGIKTVTFITTPQTHISSVREYGQRNKIEVKSIFSEPWHGAGVAEAVGNSITQLICDTINANGVNTVRTAKDVFKLISPHSSNLVYFYSDEEVHRHRELVSSGNPTKSGNKLIKPKIPVSV